MDGTITIARPCGRGGGAGFVKGRIITAPGERIRPPTAHKSVLPNAVPPATMAVLITSEARSQRIRIVASESRIRKRSYGIHALRLRPIQMSAQGPWGTDII